MSGSRAAVQLAEQARENLPILCPLPAASVRVFESGGELVEVMHRGRGQPESDDDVLADRFRRVLRELHGVRDVDIAVLGGRAEGADGVFEVPRRRRQLLPEFRGFHRQTFLQAVRAGPDAGKHLALTRDRGFDPRAVIPVFVHVPRRDDDGIHPRERGEEGAGGPCVHLVLPREDRDVPIARRPGGAARAGAEEHHGVDVRPSPDGPTGCPAKALVGSCLHGLPDRRHSPLGRT